MTSYLPWGKKNSTLFTRIDADTRIFLLSSFSLQMCNRSSRWWIPTVDLFPGDRPGDGAVCSVRSGLHLHFSCRCRGRRARIGTNRVVFITLGPNKKPRPSARDHCPAALSLLYKVALGGSAFAVVSFAFVASSGFRAASRRDDGAGAVVSQERAAPTGSSLPPT